VWDQNAGTAAGAPAATAFEMVALKWLVELLGLPPAAHGALVTGGTMANFVALAAARNHVLSQVGWDVEQQGLFGAPPITILAGHERHDTVDKAVRMLGIGKGAMTFVGTDGQGRIQPEALRRSLGKCGAGPVILCTQAGNVNSGSFDPFAAIHALIQERVSQPNPPQIWWHVDGAFGAWAKACPSLAELMAGAEHADSWSTDAHKMLNVPYDSGVVFTRHPVAHRRAMAIQAPYLSSGEESPRFAPGAFAPELSRRARGFAVWAAIRELGSLGIAELVLRLHQHAVLLASLLDQVPGARVLNEVVFNQVVVEFFPKGDEAPSQTRLLCVAIQDEGTCYPTPTLWRGSAALRFSVTNATTTPEDIHKTAAAVARVRRQFT
jgi:glutamate/tyrosine decarboxylase-like PLP-dependent enzyme